MGHYVNPKNGTKEEWLEEHGTRLPGAPVTHRHGDQVVVVLVDNGWMTAAGIAYSQNELRAFTLPDDHRPKRFYHVHAPLLAPFMNGFSIDGGGE